MTTTIVSNNTGNLELSDEGRLTLAGSDAAFVLPSYPTASLPNGVTGALVHY
jgi:hypothetical protein